MVKFTTSIVAATLLSVPVLAAASQEYEREVAESDLYGRDFPEDDVELLTREDLEDIFGRDFVEELEEREPLGFGMVSHGFHMFKHGFSHLRGHGGSGGQHRHHHLGGFSSGGDPSQQQQQPSRRELGEDPEELYAREFVDDLEEREPLGFGMVSHGFHMFKHGFSHLHGHGGSGGQHRHRHLGGFSSGGDPSQQQQQPSRRDLEELEEREPLGFGMVSHGYHALKHGLSHFHGHGASGRHHLHHLGGFGGSSDGDGSQQQQPSRRDLGDYGYFDELD